MGTGLDLNKGGGGEEEEDNNNDSNTTPQKTERLNSVQLISEDYIDLSHIITGPEINHKRSL